MNMAEIKTLNQTDDDEISELLAPRPKPASGEEDEAPRSGCARCGEPDHNIVDCPDYDELDEG
jgi:hypothetical protein